MEFNNFVDSEIKAKRKLLAKDLAEFLNDHDNVSLYYSYAKKYPEPFLRQVLGEVMDIPDEKIRKSRKALFSYLIRKHVQEATASNDNRD